MHEFYGFVASMSIPTYALLVVLSFVSLFLFLRRTIWNLFDSLLFFVFFHSFAVSVVLYMWLSGDIKVQQLFHFVTITFFFWFGFVVSHRMYPRRTLLKTIRNDLYEWRARYPVILPFILFVILFLTLVLLLSVRGIPLLSENPHQARISLYQGGFGVIRYVHSIVPHFLTVYSVRMILSMHLYSKKPRPLTVSFAVIALMLSFVTAFLTGGRSGLLGFVYIGGFFLSILPPDSSLVSKMKRWALFSSMAAVAYLVMLSLVMFQTPGQAVREIGVRFVAFGDALFFFYRYDVVPQLVSSLPINIVGFFLQPILAMLRLGHHSYPLGAYLLYYATGFPVSSFGPNGQLPIVLGLYLPQLGFLLAFGFGFGAGYLRSRVYVLCRRFGPNGIAFYAFTWGMTGTLFQDPLFFIQTMFASLVIIIPIVIVGNIVSQKHFKTEIASNLNTVISNRL